jgi:hypothetical protein
MTTAANLLAPLTGFFVFVYFANTVLTNLPTVTF